VYCGLVKRHESLKKYIKTIINQLPQYIARYSPEEQELLKEFLSIVAYYEEADFKREELENKFEKYRQEIASRENFLILPFSWFVDTYFRNARVLLSISKFHAKDFYEYLVKHFRGTTLVKGAFKLIRENTPLSDLTWEQLQYECTKLLIPLSIDQLQILETTHKLSTKIGIYSLDPRHLRNEIVGQLQFLKKTKPKIELNRLFSLTEGQWRILFFSPAFGLDRLFFHIQLTSSSTLKDLLGYHNPDNTVLTISDIYKVRDGSNTYFGLLYVPTQNVKNLIAYIKQLDNENLLILHNLQKIKTKWTSNSFAQYKPELGWINITQSQKNSLKRSFSSKKSRMEEEKIEYLHNPVSFNLNWHFTNHPLPTKLIKLYSKIAQGYSFSNLPLGSSRNQANKSITKDELGILKQLYYNRVVFVDFIPWRIVHDFSIDLYVINIPKFPRSKLNYLLNLISYSDIYETEKNVSLWTRLPQTLEHWMKKDLNWEIDSVIRDHNPRDLNYDWFDEEELQWKTPEILST